MRPLFQPPLVAARPSMPPRMGPMQGVQPAANASPKANEPHIPRGFSAEKPRGMWGSFALGLAFAAGWTPCIGPILGGILGLAATSGGWKSGLILSAFYAAGLAVPFLVTGLGINKFLGF